MINFYISLVDNGILIKNQEKEFAFNLDNSTIDLSSLVEYLGTFKSKVIIDETELKRSFDTNTVPKETIKLANLLRNVLDLYNEAHDEVISGNVK